MKIGNALAHSVKLISLMCMAYPTLARQEGDACKGLKPPGADKQMCTQFEDEKTCASSSVQVTGTRGVKCTWRTKQCVSKEVCATAKGVSTAVNIALGKDAAIKSVAGALFVEKADKPVFAVAVSANSGGSTEDNPVKLGGTFCGISFSCSAIANQEGQKFLGLSKKKLADATSWKSDLDYGVFCESDGKGLAKARWMNAGSTKGELVGPYKETDVFKIFLTKGKKIEIAVNDKVKIFWPLAGEEDEFHVMAIIFNKEEDKFKNAKLETCV